MANLWIFIIRHPGIVLVIIGVAGEIGLEWKSTHGKSSCLKKVCWILLIVGLALEIPDAAETDREAVDARLKADELEKQIAQTKNSLIEINPLNQPISDLSARVTIDLYSDKFIEPAPWWGASEVADLILLDTNLPPSLVLTAYDFKRFSVGDMREYALTFHRDASRINSPFFGKPPTVSYIMSKVAIMVIYAKFIPHDVHLYTCKVELSINGGIATKIFYFPDQMPLGKKQGGFAAGAQDDGFTIVSAQR